MIIKKGFELRTICGEQIIVAVGKENIDFCKIISMNDSAAYLWNNVKDKDFNGEMLAQLLISKYEVDHEQALTDSKDIMNTWSQAGIAE